MREKIDMDEDRNKDMMKMSNNFLTLSREKSKRVRLLAGKDGFLICFLERQQDDACIRQ